jgi:thioredoxin-related protein
MKIQLFFPILITLLFSQGVVAQEAGIQFSSEGWEAALKQAKAEDKLIFMDAYAVWCGPCKMMSKNVFTSEMVGEFYNQNFVNVKMDMERGEGVALAEKYTVQVYPTLLFLNGDGQIVHRSAGYHDVADFLGLGEQALDPKTSLVGMEVRYANGEKSPEFLFDYAMARYQAMDDTHMKIAEEYMATQDDWSTDQNMAFVFRFTEDIESPFFDYIAENRNAFEDLFGADVVYSRMQNLLYSALYRSTGDPLEEADRLFQKAYPEQADQLSSRFRMNYYRQAGDTEKYVNESIQYFEQFPSDNWQDYNEIAWQFYEEVKDIDAIKQAAEWAEKSVELDANYYNYDTLAALYYKLGKKRKARKAAEEAIELAKVSGDDYSMTEQLLEEINKL